MYPGIKEYVSFEGGKWIYLNEGNVWNVYRHKEFQRLATKPEITMVYKVLDLEKAEIVEYDHDNMRVK